MKGYKMLNRDAMTAAQSESVDNLSEYENEEALYADGFEEAYVGIIMRAGSPAVAGYDRGKCISILMNRDGMSHEEAEEFFSFNTLGAYVGENTPCFISFSDEFVSYSPSDEELERVG